MEVRVIYGFDGGDDELLAVSATALQAVGFAFNPSGDRRVARIKALSAALITEMEELRSGVSSPGAARHASIAISNLETAQMRAVKAATFDK